MAARVAQTYIVKHGRPRAQGNPSEPYLQGSSGLIPQMRIHTSSYRQPVVAQSDTHITPQGPTVSQNGRLTVNQNNRTYPNREAIIIID